MSEVDKFQRSLDAISVQVRGAWLGGKIEFNNVPVHIWRAAPRGKAWGHELEYQEKTIDKLFDKLEPLVKTGAKVAVTHRVVRPKPETGSAYDVMDIWVT